MRGTGRIAQDRPPQADPFDDALDPGVVVDDDVVAVEVRALDEDQEPHHVVEHDLLGREHDRHDQQEDRREDRPELEDPEGDDEDPGQHADAQELEQQTLDGLLALVELLRRARARTAGAPPGRRSRRARPGGSRWSRSDRRPAARSTPTSSASPRPTSQPSVPFSSMSPLVRDGYAVGARAPRPGRRRSTVQWCWLL